MKSIDSAKEQVQNGATAAGEKIAEKAIEVVSKMDEKDKLALKEQALKVADAGQHKVAKVLKTTKAVLESPEASIISKIAGEKAEEKLKQGQNIVNEALQNQMIVGNHGSLMQNGTQYQGPPVVSAIQAIDQYGNVMATAQNPKIYEMMRQY